MLRVTAEFGRPTNFERLTQGSVARDRNLELGRRTQIELNADQTFSPNNVTYLQDFLMRRSDQAPFVTAGVRAFAESTKAPLKTAVQTLEAGAIAIAVACSSPQPKMETLPTQAVATEIAKPAESTNTVEPKSTATAVPFGGSEDQLSKNPRINELDRIIRQGKADETQIKEFNALIIEQEGPTTWTTEKGEVKQLPQIDGLKTVYFAEAGNNKLKIIYMAKEKNPYGLEAGDVGGVFHPEVFDVIDNAETAPQVGTATLRAEVVRKMLELAGSPKQSVLFPLPVDISGSKEKKALMIQESIPTSGQSYIFLKMASESVLVIPLQEPGKPASASLNPQSWGGTSIRFRSPRFLNLYELSPVYADTLPRKSFDDGKLGDPIGVVSKKSFNSYPQFPDLMPETNMYFEARQPFTNDGNITRYRLTRSNILRTADGTYIAVMSNENPLLN